MPNFSHLAWRSEKIALFHPEWAPSPLTLTAAEFKAAFPGESQYVEFKRGTSMDELRNTAVAFSNADGGVILIGVRDDGMIAARALDAGTQDDIHRAMQAARDVGR